MLIVPKSKVPSVRSQRHQLLDRVTKAGGYDQNVQYRLGHLLAQIPLIKELYLQISTVAQGIFYSMLGYERDCILRLALGCSEKHVLLRGPSCGR